MRGPARTFRSWTNEMIQESLALFRDITHSSPLACIIGLAIWSFPRRGSVNNLTRKFPRLSYDGEDLRAIPTK
jgi:hypothetical protein